MHLPPLERIDIPLYAVGRRATRMFLSTDGNNAAVNLDSLQQLILRALPWKKSSIAQVETIAGSHLHQLFVIQFVDATRLVLKCQPPHSVRRLRHEYHQLDSEAQILSIVATNTSVPVPVLLCQDHELDISLLDSASGSLLTAYINGRSLESIAQRLRQTSRDRIDKSLGTYIKALTNICGPAFGPVSAILDQSGGDSCMSWRASFASLLESALRDAEDMLVSMPYFEIRSMLQIYGWALDDVQTPHLAPMEAGLPANVLVDEEGESVVALLGLGNAIFGDPMISPVFSNSSKAFWEGFGQRKCPSRSENIRMLLYSMYHSLLSVVVHYYRPSHDDTEMHARLSLMWSLTQLSNESRFQPGSFHSNS